MKTKSKRFSTKAMSGFMAVMIVTTFLCTPTVMAKDTNLDAKVSVLYNGEQTTDFVLPQNEKTELSAEVSSENGTSYNYQWQILADKEKALWANIYDATSKELSVSYALTASVQDESGSAYVRCKIDNGTEFAVSNPVCVTTSFTSTVKSKAKTNASNTRSVKKIAEQSDIVTITINYLDDTTHKEVYSSYTANIEKGKSFKQDVISPTYIGYEPYWTQPDGKEADASTLKLDYTNVENDITINVYYKPSNVPYGVSYYFQNIYDNHYTLDTSLSQRLFGVTGSTVSDDDLHEAVKNKVGFTPLYHIPTTIAGDGSTVIDSYYDRNYYLFTFDMDGGYGTDPIYARYESSFLVNQPTRVGYTFEGWDLVSYTLDDGNESEVKYVEDGKADVLPTIMPAEDCEYKALWKKTDTTFTVVYWLQNPDDDDYSYLGKQDRISAQSGDVINGEDYKNINTVKDIASKVDSYTRDRYVYKTADKNVVVSGDGSTVVNVYYDRKVYDLRFIYAREGLTGSSKGKFYIKGGSTYNFGSGENYIKTISADNGTNALVPGEEGQEGSFVNYLLSRDQGASSNGGWGEVTALPELKKQYKNEKIYSTGTYTTTIDYKSDTPNEGETFKYYYVECKARYQQNISNLWLTDPFDPPELSQAEMAKNHKKYYPDGTPLAGTPMKKAYFAGWNGEHFVKYSYRNNGNQTIKGKYQRLDDMLLFDVAALKECYPNEPEHQVVNYLCFFDNGSNWVTWNTPNKWTYEYYYPTLNNVKGDIEKDGVNYYLRGSATCYDDGTHVMKNSYTYQQTPTSLEGMTFKGFDESDQYGTVVTDENDDAYGIKSYIAKFFYSRNDYQLTFYNYDKTEKQVTVPFETPLKSYSFKPSYPSNLEKGAYTFGGWYTSPNCLEGTEVDFDSDTMPASNTMLYAKWIPVDHSVRVFQNYSYLEAFNKNEVETDEYALYLLDAIDHTETRETSYIWLNHLNYATADSKGVYKVSYFDDEREYVKVGDYFYRKGRANNLAYTIQNGDTKATYVYVDDGNRKGYVKADGLLGIRHQAHGYVLDNFRVPNDPSGYTFAGWRYNKNGNVEAFSPLDTPITADFDVYADWGSKKSSPYVVHYALEEGVNSTLSAKLFAILQNPSDNEIQSIDNKTYVYLASDKRWHLIIADDTTGFRFEGTTVTFTPKVGNPSNELYDGYNKGYYPTLASHSILVQSDELNNIKNNAFTFTYVNVPTITYTVEYRYNEPSKPLLNDFVAPNADSQGIYGKKVVTTSNNVVTERFQVVKDCVPDDTYKQLVLSVEKNENGQYVSSADNIITFYYTKQSSVAPYIIHYMMQNPGTDGTNYAVDGTGDYTENEGNLIKGVADIGEVTAYPLTFTGYELNKKAVVVDGGTTKSDATFAADSDDKTTIKFNVTEKGTELYVFYNIQKTYYRVFYLVYGTATDNLTQYEDETKFPIGNSCVLSKYKKVENQYFGDTVIENSVDIDGWTCLNASKSITLTYSPRENNPSDVGYKNNIVFFYTPTQYTVEYKTVGGGSLSQNTETIGGSSTNNFAGSTPTADRGYEFDNWYLDEACTQKVTDDSQYSAFVSGNKLTPTKEKLTPNYQAGQASTIFYAKFNAKGGYKVNYDLNGGTINGSSSVDSKTVAWDSTNLGTEETPVKHNTGFIGWKLKDKNIDVTDETTYGALAIAVDSENEVKEVTLVAQWTETKVYFHSNIDGKSTAQTADLFRTYTYTGNDYTMNDDSTINSFYDIPSVEKNTKIFAGWYYDDGTAYKWSDVFAGETHLYAHWLDVGTVAKTADDTKVTGVNNYNGFDLFGTQIRNAKKDDNYPDGSGSTPAYSTSGLRFVTSLSDSLLKQIDALSDSKPEYGYVLAKTATAKKYANGKSDYQIEYKDDNVNGVDTRTEYKYVQNINCTSQVGGYGSGAPAYDHFNSKAKTYRIYSLVVTYDSSGRTEEQIEQAKGQELLARSYIRYTDANGLLRTYYNDYTGTNVFGGCSTSFNNVLGIIEGDNT